MHASSLKNSFQVGSMSVHLNPSQLPFALNNPQEFFLNGSLSQLVMTTTQRGDCAELQELLTLNANCLSEPTDAPLAEATKMNRSDLVRVLLPYSSEYGRGCAGIKAATHGSLDAMRELLTQGPFRTSFVHPAPSFINQIFGLDAEPFLDAIVREATRCAQLDVALAALAVAPDPLSAINRSYVVIQAAKEGRTEVLQEFLASGPIFAWGQRQAVDAAARTGLAGDLLIPILNKAEICPPTTPLLER